MVSVSQIERGAAAFVDRHMVPVMPKAKGIAFAAFAPLVIKAKVSEYAPLVQSIGLMGENQTVDLESIYGAFKEKAQGKWPLEVLGFKVSESDLDNLYRCIKEA